MKILSILMLITVLILSACGSERNSNQEPKVETQLDSQPENVPNTGNGEPEEENDVGIPENDENKYNDELFEGP